ncbi:MAG TPA: AEC family transporter [Methanocorpusculum sp.]|nr:AEC family transporter [Methanocorpusculum sp.]
MEYLIALNQILLMFILVLVGFFCRKMNILPQNAVSAISKFLLSICIPAMVISAMQIPFSTSVMGNVGLTLVAALIYYVIGIVFACFLPKMIRAKKEEVGVFRYMIIFGNTMFMGFPVISMIFGQEALFYAAIFNIPFNLLSFSFGIWILKKESGVKFSPRIFLNAAFISTIVGLVMFLISFTIPEPIGGAIDLIGGMTVPLSLIIIGGYLANFPIKKIFTNFRQYIVAGVRLLVVPFATWILCSQFINNSVILGIAVITAAMPAAVNTVMLAETHDAHPNIAAQGVFISTLIGMVTIPFFAVFFG